MAQKNILANIDESLLGGAYPLILIGEFTGESRDGAAAVLEILGLKIDEKIQSNLTKIHLKTKWGEFNEQYFLVST